MDSLVIDRENTSHADYVGVRLQGLSVIGSTFDHCSFDRISVKSACLGSGGTLSVYRDCSFDGARLQFFAAGLCRFERCSFRDVVLRRWFCMAVEFVDCAFSGRIIGSVFNGTVPEDSRERAGRDVNEFSGNDFSQASLEDVGFRTGIDLRDQRLPEGPDYLYLADPMRSIKFARARVAEYGDVSVLAAAASLLDSLEMECSGGQRQLLLNQRTYGARSKNDKARDLVFSSLREAS